MKKKHKEMSKCILSLLLMLFSSFVLYAEEATGSCSVGSGNEYVEATAFLTENGNNKYTLKVVAANAASSPLVNLNVVVTAEKSGGGKVTLQSGMIFLDKAIPQYSTGVVVADKEINYSSKLSNLSVSVKNAKCVSGN